MSLAARLRAEQTKPPPTTEDGQKPRETTDPRPDLIEDSTQWDTLLLVAHMADHDAFGALHGMRCLGARLRRTASGNWVLRPDPGTELETEWKELSAKWLAPHTETVKALLRGLSDR